MPSRPRITGLAVVLAVVVFPLVGAAQVPQGLLGTWELNVAKSKADPGPLARSQTLRWEAAPGGGAKIVSDTVDAVGKATHNELVTMFDGKAVEVKGAAQPTMRAYSRIDNRTYQWFDSVNGKVSTTTRSTMTADGKTRTVVATGTNADGKPVNNTLVYERQ